ncbi:hypothetical protein RvY_17202 [Ramazzottius varieornatus]|uniref:Uncharacterized protein n=1 Tax=Ramazzottius varieornatus TaxID=947166 RepID=A0A1D1W3M2_RAMVA|nr:hypothetical protein RvY_17202 [Ramazzottius varieornatus]
MAEKHRQRFERADPENFPLCRSTVCQIESKPRRSGQQSSGVWYAELCVVWAVAGSSECTSSHHHVPSSKIVKIMSAVSA